MSGIDEKTAVFSIFLYAIGSWKDKQNATDSPSKNVVDRIKSDIDALGKYALSMNEHERINSHGTLRKIAETLDGKVTVMKQVK